MNYLGISAADQAPTSVAAWFVGGLVAVVVGAVLGTLGWFVFKGEPRVLDDQWRNRKDLRTIGRIIGGGFMLGGAVFLGTGLLCLLDGVLQAALG